jgi:hypothetical protein
VTRFGGRAIAALAVWAGLAMLGYGPRASAAFLPALSLPAATGPCGAGAPDTAPVEQAPTVWPPADQPHRLLDALSQGLDGSTSGGAGAPSPTSPTGPSTPALGATGHVELPVPDAVTRLRTVWTLFVPSPLVTAIFEPPRAD